MHIASSRIFSSILYHSTAIFRLSQRSAFLLCSAICIIAYLGLVWKFYIFGVLAKNRQLVVASSHLNFEESSSIFLNKHRNASRIGLFLVAQTDKQAKAVRQLTKHICNDKLLYPNDVVLFFVFSPDNIANEQQNFKLSNCNVTTISRRNHFDNPCLLYYENDPSDHFRYSSKVDFIVHLNHRLKFAKSFYQLASLFVYSPDGSTAIGEETFDNSHRGAKIYPTQLYSADFFGASVDEFYYLCGNVTSQRSAPFLYRYNEYLAHRYPAKIVTYQRHGVEIAPYRWNLTEFLSFYESAEIYRSAKVHQDKIARMVDALWQNYIKSNREFLNNSLKLETSRKQLGKKFLQFSYYFPENSAATAPFPPSDRLLGAKQLRGLVVALFLAISNNRIFHIDFPDIGYYFKVNHEWYGAGEKPYLAQRHLAWNLSTIWLLDDEASDSEIVSALRNNTYMTDIGNRYDNIMFASMRYAGLAGILKNELFGPILRFMLSGYDDEDYRYDYSLLIGTGLRLIFSNPTQNFQELIDRVARRIPFWSNSTRFGVDLTGMAKAVGLIAEEVHRLVKLHVRTSWRPKQLYQVVIYVAHDNETVANSFKLEFQRQLKDVKIFYLDPTDKFNYKHLFEDEIDEQKVEEARRYVDWFMLTKCHFLVITQRSWFGETAAMFSSVPARRLMFRKPRALFQDYYNLNMGEVSRTGFVIPEDLL